MHARVIAALEALEAGDVRLAETILLDLELDLEADENRWIRLADVPDIPDMSVFDDAA